MTGKWNGCKGSQVFLLLTKNYLWNLRFITMGGKFSRSKLKVIQDLLLCLSNSVKYSEVGKNFLKNSLFLPLFNSTIFFHHSSNLKIVTNSYICIRTNSYLWIIIQYIESKITNYSFHNHQILLSLSPPTDYTITIFLSTPAHNIPFQPITTTSLIPTSHEITFPHSK